MLERGACILQPDLDQFETRLVDFTGARHVIGVANGTDALLLALRSIGIGPGDDVIVPSHTYVASVAAIHFVGATPVLVECGPDRLISAGAVEHAVTERSRAIMPVQLNGQIADMDALGVTRFFMTVEEAVQLIIQAGAVGAGGDILVLDMGDPVSIADLARRMIAGSDHRVEIVFTGLRPREKMAEVLFSPGERPVRRSHPLIHHVAGEPLPSTSLHLVQEDDQAATLKAVSRPFPRLFRGLIRSACNEEGRI